ncbi:MAG: hypothetical protein ACK5D5_11495 [Bacteroidota bacterium]|jgi:hypothetical protein
MSYRRKSSRNSVKRKKRKLFFSELVVSRPYQYYFGRDQLKETYPDQFDDDYSYYRFPESRRDFYNKDFGRESSNVPDYYRDNVMATAFAERYPKVNQSSRKLNKIMSRLRKANEHQGIERFAESMDVNLYNNILDELENREVLPYSTNLGKRRVEFISGGGGGFSRFGKFDLGKDETREEEGLGRRVGKYRFGRSGKRNFRKRK